MIRLIERFYLCLLISLAFLSTAQAATQMDVSASRDTLYLGESLILTIRVSGANPVPTPDLSQISGCEISALGSTDNSHYSISIINGKVSRQGYSGRTFSYNITPKQTGTLQLGPIRILSGSDTVSSPGPTVRVTGIEEQDDVIIRVKASRDTVLVDESFEVLLEVLIKALPDPYKSNERLLTDAPPHLSVPYLVPAQLDGLEHASVSTILQAMLAERTGLPGFMMNDYSLRNDPFDFQNMFNFNDINRARPAVFVIPRGEVTINGKPYLRYFIETKYTAKEERTHTFGPVIFKGNIIDSISATGQPAAREVFAVGPSATVRVTPPPDEGRPVSFIGAIGTNLHVDASLDTQNCRAGDPLTLKLTVSGGVNLKNIYPPDLLLQPGLGKQFKIYDDTLSMIKNEQAVSFTWTVRPTEAGSLEFPPVEASYFDVSSRSYRTVKTLPVPVKAEQAGGLDSGMIFGASTNTIAKPDRMDFQKNYTAPFLTSPSAAIPQKTGLSYPCIILLSGSPLVFLLSLAVRPVMRLRRKAAGISKKKSVYSDAVKELKLASRLPYDQAAHAVSSAIRTYTGARFSVSPTALTPPEILKLAKDAAIKPSSLDALAGLLQRTFNASFSNEKHSQITASDIQSALEIISELEATREKPKDAGLASALAILILLIPSLSMAESAPETEADFLWQKAWSQTLSANTSEDFNRLARTYRELAAGGTRNAVVFHNLGTALLLAGDRTASLEALQRAEMYGGYNQATLHNIQEAASDDTRKETSVSWTRIIFFWHHLMPITLRTNVFAGAWTLLFIALSLYRISGRQANRFILGTIMLIVIAFASSVLTSALQEHQARIRDTYLAQRNGGQP